MHQGEGRRGLGLQPETVTAKNLRVTGAVCVVKGRINEAYRSVEGELL